MPADGRLSIDSHELRFAVMGSTAHVIVTGRHRELLGWAAHRLAELESKWSRFRPDSELSQLNDRPGQLVMVSDDTFVLIRRLVSAWQLTGGRFDPTVLDAVRAAGYDRDFASVGAAATVGSRPVSEEAVPTGTPGCAGIRFDEVLRAVHLPERVHLDPGGLGKGLAADLVTGELLGRGARGAMVNVGGDLRARGLSPDGGTWAVGVAHPFEDDRDLLRLGVADGAVATSSTLRRRWHHDGEPRHHLIDPVTGAPSTSPLVAVTVVAAEGWWAEALTKATLVAGVAADAADLPGALAVTIDEAGHTVFSPELAALAR